MKYFIGCLFVFFAFSACKQKKVDLLIKNATVYTVDEKQPTAEAIAIKDGRIVWLGENADTKQLITPDTKVIDANGAFVMPGFIEAHGHFSGLGKALLNLDLMETKSWEEVVRKVKIKAATSANGEVIYGRGWHQEKWTEAPEQNYFGYPSHEALSAVSPNNPVILNHASGHAIIVNEAAMNIAGVNSATKDVEGGRIIRDENGEPIGVFEENAENLIIAEFDKHPKSRISEWQNQVAEAQKECLKNGITSFQDAGALFWEVDQYEKMAYDGELDVRLWSMLSSGAVQPITDENTAKFPMINVGDGFFTCRSIKGYMDGALGSRGAWLLQEYADSPAHFGQNVTPLEEIERTATIAKKKGLQYCVHAIGDRGNRELLNIMQKVASKSLNQLRWRVEHAQHLNPSEVSTMAENDIIASMQAVHCTSDSPFVEARLGQERAEEGAYIWQTLRKAGVRMANGTDVPVERINPIENFYAAVTRKRKDSDTAFYPSQKLTREEAIKLYTLDNAYAAFEEKQKGSLEIDKYADLVILDNNLITCSDNEILETQVLYTIVNGDVKYTQEASK